MRVVSLLVLASALIFVPVKQALAHPGDGFAELNDRLSPAVVNISTAQRVNQNEDLPIFPPGSPLERFNDLLGNNEPRMARSLGSGFTIDPKGIVVTNHHVIDDADEVEVVLKDGTVLAAEVIGRDPATDLAVLRVNPESPLPSVQFGNSENSRVGDWVVAIGNPFGLGGSLTAGVISARGRDIGGRYDDYIQTDVAINRGNSGGPLFNLEGDVIGVNTAIFSPTGASVGISFSVPSSVAEPVIKQLIDNGVMRRGWLGVNVQGLTMDMAQAMGLDSAKGAVVTRIDPNGPAARSKLKVGDVVMNFKGEQVVDDRAFTVMAAASEPDSEAEIEVLRKGRRVSFTVEIGLLNDESQQNARSDLSSSQDEDTDQTTSLLGMTLAPLTDALRRQYRVHPSAKGLIVIGIDPQSDAVGKVRTGDVIEEIAWTAVSSLEQAIEVLNAADKGPVLFSLNRKGAYVLQTLTP